MVVRSSCSLLLLAISSSLLSPPTTVEASLLGFGVNRLKGFRGHGRLTLQGEEGGGDEGTDQVEELYYGGAIVDNFAAVEDQRFWESRGQRYFVNEAFWGGDGSPIFLMIGGEGPESKRCATDAWYYYELAKHHNALMVCLEHRFYGQSYPTRDMSNSNLRFLTSEQALADLARFIDFFTKKMKAPRSKWISFGGSYPGNLAAWLRLKYPHLTHGSVASSAPIRVKEDFTEYMDVVADALRYFGGEACVQAMGQAVRAVAAAIDEKDLDGLAKDFRLCDTITNTRDVWVLESNLMGNVQGTVQYNAERNTTMTVSDVCAIMTRPASDPYQQFVELNTKYLAEQKQECLETSWKKSLDEMNNATFDGLHSSRQWVFQTCNEFGYFQSPSGRLLQPFSPFKAITLQSYRDICEIVYGIDLAPQESFSNTYYGALDIEASNVIFPSGTIDPWHALGITNDTSLSSNSESPVFILGTAHCHDMRQPQPSDPPELTWARQTIARTVARWVQE